MVFSSMVLCVVSSNDDPEGVCLPYSNISKISINEQVSVNNMQSTKDLDSLKLYNIIKRMNISSYSRHVVRSNASIDFHNENRTMIGNNLCCDLCPEYIAFRKTLLFGITILLSMLLCKEVFQVVDSPRRYFKSLDNVLIWPIIFMTFTIVIFVWKNDKTCPLTYHIAAIDILFVWIELLLHIGRFPLFGLYVQMFSLVAKNFGKFLLAYLCIINAFALSFGVLLDEDYAFQHYLFRIIKVLAMMTGELEYDEIFGTAEVKYSITTHLVFALFLLFGTIILMNLLVGLAVSDIQGLQKSAVLDRLVWQTELLAHFEGVMFSKWLSFIIPQNAVKFIHGKLLLLPSLFGNTFLVNTNTISQLSPELLESIRRSARNRDIAVRRRQAFANFRTMSNAAQYSIDLDGDIVRTMEAIRTGLDVLVWDAEERKRDVKSLKSVLTQLTTTVQGVSRDIKSSNCPSHCCSDNVTSCSSSCNSLG